MTSLPTIIKKIATLRRRKEKLLEQKRDIFRHFHAPEKRNDASATRLSSRMAARAPEIPASTLTWEQLLDTNRVALEKVDNDLVKTFRVLATVSPDPLATLSDDKPIVLLPLRLETRFMFQGTQLWIRVFPDDIATYRQEEALTVQEITAGEQFWERLWNGHLLGKPAEETHRSAWSQVANLFEVNRANWIIRETKPSALGAGMDFNTFSGNLTHKLLKPKEQAWSQPAISNAMPDYLELRLYDENEQPWPPHNPAMFTGNLIPSPLQIGIDPIADVPLPGSDKAWAGTGVAWLEDFEQAVKVGLGFKIDLQNEGWSGKYFSKILVFGVKSITANAAAAAKIGRISLEELLSSHKYSPGGLGLLRQGTPTNNTDEKDAGYVPAHGFSERHFQLELQPDIAALAKAAASDADKPDSLLLTEALGLDVRNGVFSKIEYSQSEDCREAILMNRALYPATLGFLAENMLHPVFTETDLKTLRDFFIHNVSGRGPLPALRVGGQPYGVLVTSDFEAWEPPQDAFQTGLYHILKELDKAWKLQANNVVSMHHHATATDPVGYLDEVLSLHPTSVQFWQRIAYSENLVYAQNPYAGTRYRNPQLLKVIEEVYNLINSSNFGIKRKMPPTPEGFIQFSKLFFDFGALPLNSAFVVDSQPLSEYATVEINHLKINYLTWLRLFFIKPDEPPQKFDDKRDYYGLEPGATPLLYLYLRHSLNMQLYKCAYYWLQDRGELPSMPGAPELSLFSNFDPSMPWVDYPTFIAGKEFFNIYAPVPGSNMPDITPAELLRIDAPLFDPNVEDLGGYLLRDLDNIAASFKPKTKEGTEFNQLIEYRNALENLQDFSTACLERCFVEHLDCLNYRLDAWQTGLFYQKLKTLRNSSKGKRDSYLGAYGWLENVGATLDAPEPGGFIHAPSLAQAKTAALLRNAYLHYNEGSYSDLMAVNLSSARVREAMYLFDGLRKGQELGALLGYQLERGLHDLSLDVLIEKYRAAFPLQKMSIQDSNSLPKEPDAGNPKPENPVKPPEWMTVANGLALVQSLEANEYGIPFPLIPSNLVGKADELKTLLNRLKDNLDAMKDVLVTESVHQMALGNYDRAGALLKSVGSDLAPPAVLESIATPRTAETMVTHRLCLLFESFEMSGVPPTPKAGFEPGLNRWLGNLIGSLSDIVVQVTYNNQSSNANPYMNLSDLNLGLAPIDLIYLVSKGADTWKHELGQRIGYAYRNREGISDDVPLEILFEVPGEKTFPSLLPLLFRLKELVCSARPMHGEDADLATHAGKSNAKNYAIGPISTNSKWQWQWQNVGGLLSRLESAFNGLTSHYNRLKNYLSAYPLAENTSPELSAAALVIDVRRTLLSISHFDLPDAIPHTAHGGGAAEKKLLAKQINQLLPAIEKRRDDVLAEKVKAEKGAAPSIEQEVVILSSLISKLLGNGFQALPRFTFSGDGAGQVERAAPMQLAYISEAHLFNYVQQKTGLASRRLHLQNWLDGVAKVRQRVETFEWVRTLAANSEPTQDAQGNIQEPLEVNMHVLQLPYQPGDSWLGLEFPEGAARQQHKLSLLIHHPGELFSAANDDMPWCGLVVDDWVESIPGKEELTGVAMNYSQPGTQAPQAILLAIAPQSTGAWSTDALEGVLLNTLQRAKQRAVDSDQIANTEWAGLLPALLGEIPGVGNVRDRRNVSLNFSQNV